VTVWGVALAALCIAATAPFAWLFLKIVDEHNADMARRQADVDRRWVALRARRES